MHDLERIIVIIITNELPVPLLPNHHSSLLCLSFLFSQPSVFVVFFMCILKMTPTTFLVFLFYCILFSLHASNISLFDIDNDDEFYSDKLTSVPCGDDITVCIYYVLACVRVKNKAKTKRTKEKLTMS